MGSHPLFESLVHARLPSFPSLRQTHPVSRVFPVFSDSLLVGEARRQFFAASGFDAEGGYTKPVYWLGWKWFRVPVPNTAGRVRAVRLHDLHHLATGYPTTWHGEAEIGAWELAGGCGRYIAAWVLNLYAFDAGLFIAPRSLWRAFVRGRRSRTLYCLGVIDDDILQLPLGDLRSRLGLQHEAPSGTAEDAWAFAAAAAAALFQGALTVAVPLALLGGLLLLAVW